MELVCFSSIGLKSVFVSLIAFIVLSTYLISTITSMGYSIPFFWTHEDQIVPELPSCDNESSHEASHAHVLRAGKDAVIKYDRELKQLRGDFVLDKPKTTYLVPITKVLHTVDGINDSFSEHILRSGLGLHAYKTEKKEDIWSENGVQYRPFPFLERKDNQFYTSEFEAYVPFRKATFFELGERSASMNMTTKKIILWWQNKIAHAPINGLNPLRACPDFPCVLTSDRNYTEESSAMLINAQFVDNESPPKRRPDQVLIHYQIEAPFNYWFYGEFFERDKGWNDVFNWTMSYRMDADITTYHGLVRRRRVVKEKNYEEILSRKKGLVAWMVSNCVSNSRREDYVRELRKYIPVDIYGGCGDFNCPRMCDKECLASINLKYKFYLSFENNLCRDYITEKLYRYFDSDMIVIVRGFNTYSRLLPSDVFLNTADFKKPEDLAERLLYLDSHDDEYIQMLREKDKYFSVYEDYPLYIEGLPWMEYRFEAVAMCEVCRRIWNLQHFAKVYPDMSSWFYKEEYQCRNPKDLEDSYSGYVCLFLCSFAFFVICFILNNVYHCVVPKSTNLRRFRFQKLKEPGRTLSKLATVVTSRYDSLQQYTNVNTGSDSL